MINRRTLSHLSLLALLLINVQEPAMARSWFKPLKLQQKETTFNIPSTYNTAQPNASVAATPIETTALINWRDFFDDPHLTSLIETALANNQEINIFMQDVEIAKNEVKEKQGEYLPKVGLGLGAGGSKSSRFTTEGVLDKIIERSEIRDRDSEVSLAANLTWEVDIWHKLRNAKDAATMRFLAQNEGRHYLVSRLVAEIARNYYELMALDNSLKIIDDNIDLQTKAFLKMQALKEYAKSNQLAVNRFEAQLLKTKSERYEISQQIVEKENRLRQLSGIYNENPILRSSDKLMTTQEHELQIGVPAQLLENRPDIRQAELEIKAAKLDLKSVKANLYPSLGIKAGVGYAGFDPTFLFNPKSLIYNIVGDLMAPIINRKAIIAKINIADSHQTQMVLNYEQTLLQAYTDVLNQMSKIKNLQQGFETKQREVRLLDDSVDIANSLFQYAKADYVEVLLTQEEKLNAQKDLVELKMNLIGSKVDLYRALGGGWR